MPKNPFSTENKFYVYVHKKPNGRVFYVGKGSSNRHKSQKDRSDYWHKIVNKYGFYSEIVKEAISECEAFELEQELIRYYGRENLCNHTDGGDGPSGYRHDHFTRLKMSYLRIGKKHSEETKKKMSEWHKKNSKPPFKGKNLSENHKKAVAAGVSGEKNGRYNKLRHRFIHPDHGYFEGTQRELIEEYGLHHGAVSGMVKGSVGSVKGWKIDYRDNPSPP